MTITLDQLNDDYDWREAFGYAGEPRTCADYQSGTNVVSLDDVDATAFSRSDVVSIVHSAEGEPDGDDWLMVGQLMDGRFFYLSAGCDYTGWD